MNTSFWYDYSTPFKPLITLFGQSGPQQLGVSDLAMVNQAYTSSGWSVRPARSAAAEQLQTYLTTIPLPASLNSPDKFVWHIANRVSSQFSTQCTWEELRLHHPFQSWASNVWFKGAIPRQAFNMWVACLDRFPTRARLTRWGLNSPTGCCLCNAFEEIRDHLFLRCEISGKIWDQALRKLGFENFRFYTWTAFTMWLSSSSSVGRPHNHTLKRLVAQVVIYHIWLDRTSS